VAANPESPESQTGGGKPTFEASAGAQYSVLIRSQMDEEAAYRATLEQRATNVITSSGTLVSLLFAFTALAKGSDRLVLPGISKVTLILALVCFVAAVVIALAYVGLLRIATQSIDLGDVSKLLTPEYWSSPDALTSSLVVGEAQLAMLRSSRSANQARARFVAWAVGMEVLAVLFLGSSIVGILIAY
jgi:uncharacterized membrane protein (DUF485 family)